MALIRRLTSMLKADAHGVVDAVEDRDLLVRQHVREAEVALASKRARVDVLSGERKGLEHESERARTEIEQLDQDVELALEARKDDLARFSIKRLLPLRRASATLDARLTQVRAEQSQLEGDLIRQETELAELKARARAFLTRPDRTAEASGVVPSDVVADEEIELELMRRKQGASEEG